MKKYINNNIAVFMALFAALLFGLNAPLSKLLLKSIPPMLMASLLYIGAGIGMLIIYLLKKDKNKEASLDKGERKWAVLMILLDILAPFLLMYGLTKTSSANASLLFNFEMVATTLVALMIFKEAIGKRMWIAISLITFSSIILTFDFSKINDFSFSFGSLFVILACATWGFENNFTRNMSHKDPFQIVILKGFGSGVGAFIVFLLIDYKNYSINVTNILFALFLGFVSYGLSIYFYVKAQRYLGASRTSAFYAAAPFLGVIFSFLIFKDSLSLSFFIALIIMIIGTLLAINENHEHLHLHKNLIHEHMHSHSDIHHAHSKEDITHSHIHSHEEIEHKHSHKPDIHHRHIHKKED